MNSLVWMLWKPPSVMLSVGSLFTGCGGLDLGLEQTGLYRIAWACENDPACRRVLAHHYPEIPVHDDVRTLYGYGPVDVLVGGFPCQDLSHAGKGAGLDGDRSGLWFAYADAIRLLRPRLVLVENVPGLATRGLGRVLYDLAKAGYVGSWLRLRASDVGAPHGRERIFILARLAADAARERLDWAGNGGQGRRREPADGDREAAADAGVEPGQPRHGGRAASSPDPRRGAPQRDRYGLDGPAEPGQAVTTAWGVYEPAIRRWEHTLGRAAPRPTDDRGRLMPGFVEWMLGFPDGWTEGESRTQRLRMLGNAVQVQCGTMIGYELAAMLVGEDAQATIGSVS